MFARHRPDDSVPRAAHLAAAALIALVYLWIWRVCEHRIWEGPSFAGFADVFRTGCGDFEHFFHAAQAMREGRDIYASGVHGYIYPPLIAFLYLPLTLLSVQAAAQLALLLNMALALACTWAASREALRHLGRENSGRAVLMVMALTTLFAAPRVRSELQMWQTNLLMTGGLVLALRWLETRPRLAGLALGFVVNIKYLPIVFVPYLLLRRRYTAAAGSVLGILVFALLPALATGLHENLREWTVAAGGLARLFGIAPAVAQVANIDPITSGYSFSVTSGFARLLGPDARGTAWALSALAFAGALAVVGTARRRIGTPVLPLDWAALVVLALAFSPQTNPRHVALLLLAFAPLAAMICVPRPGARPLMAIAACALMFGGFVLASELNPVASMAVWWNRIGGQSWCMLAALPLMYLAHGPAIDAPAPWRSTIDIESEADRQELWPA